MRTFTEWKTLLAQIDAPWAPMPTIEELLDDPRSSPTTTSARSSSTTSRLSLPLVPVQFDEQPPELRHAPEHGEHTEQVLLELGYSWDDIAALAEAGGDPVTGVARPLPVPDEQSAPYWDAAAEGVLTMAGAPGAAPFAHPPTSSARTAAHRPGFAFEPVSGRGRVRSWTVVRQSFLPGFDDDLPFVLVDVALDEQRRRPPDRPPPRRA